MDPDPAVHVRLELERARQRGEPFAQAWSSALDGLPLAASGKQGEGWEAALAATRTSWRRAYFNEPPLAAELTAAALAAMASGA